LTTVEERMPLPLSGSNTRPDAPYKRVWRSERQPLLSRGPATDHRFPATVVLFRARWTFEGPAPPTDTPFFFEAAPAARLATTAA
jgi:hypothetical protein